VLYEIVRSPEEDLGRQVPTKFATQGALDRDGLKGKFIPARGHVAAALLAGHDEGLAA